MRGRDERDEIGMGRVVSRRRTGAHLRLTHAKVAKSAKEAKEKGETEMGMVGRGCGECGQFHTEDGGARARGLTGGGRWGMVGE